jgi:hypothetical protein
LNFLVCVILCSSCISAGTNLWTPPQLADGLTTRLPLLLNRAVRKERTALNSQFPHSPRPAIATNRMSTCRCFSVYYASLTNCVESCVALCAAARPLLKFLAHIDGRDKGLKVVQYGLKLAIFKADPSAGTSKEETLKRLGNFIAALSTARKIMRLSNFLDPLSRLIGAC